MLARILSRTRLSATVAVLAFGQAADAGGSPQERLYLIDGSGGILVTYDPVTLKRLSLQVTGNINGMSSLTWGQGRLYTIERNVGIVADQLVQYHPATGAALSVGPTGISYSNAPAIKYDPTRDEFFVLYQEFTTPAEVWYPDLYKIDPETGKMTYVARVSTGSGVPTFGALAMAIGPQDEAFVSEPSSGNEGPRIGLLDLLSGVVRPRGPVPIGVGRFRDMSFDAAGRLWVLHDDVDDSKDGIYTVDPVALTFEPKLLTKAFPLSGMNAIAVVPLPAMSAYCEPSNGTTCAPTIDWKGLPSATADSGFQVLVRGTPSGSTGLMLFGNGMQGPPFQGSTLCFGPPYLLSTPAPSVPSGTGSACDGTWSIDLNPEILAAGFLPGDTLHAQWMGLDPAAPPGSPRVTSNALEFDLAP